jgi:GDSL-like Lipase/Acylhydrolase family
VGAIAPGLTALAMLSSVLAGCTVTGDAGSAGASKSAEIDLVVIGDSIADAAHCPFCTGFMETFRAHVEDSLDHPVHSTLVTTLTVPDAQAAVLSEQGTRELLAQAEIIIVEVGYNNALPDPETGIGCGGSLSQGYSTWMASTTEECLAAGVETYGELYDSIFDELKALRTGQPTVFIVTNSTDGNIDPNNPTDLLALLAPEEQQAGKEWTVEQYDRWNSMLAERTEAAGFTLVDLYHRLNGADGTVPFGPLSVDGAHPSQAGNDLIAEALSGVDLSALTIGGN